jgi:hypothetical protein
LMTTLVRRGVQLDPPGAAHNAVWPGERVPEKVGVGGAGSPEAGRVESSAPVGGRDHPTGVVPGPVIVDGADESVPVFPVAFVPTMSHERRCPIHASVRSRDEADDTGVPSTENVVDVDDGVTSQLGGSHEVVVPMSVVVRDTAPLGTGSDTTPADVDVVETVPALLLAVALQVIE